jgi:hypothetical protein
VIHDQDGRPLELCESRYAGARYGLDVQFDVELSSFQAGHGWARQDQRTAAGWGAATPPARPVR